MNDGGQWKDGNENANRTAEYIQCSSRLPLELPIEDPKV